MLTEVDDIPNEPGLCVIVAYDRPMHMFFGPHRGKMFTLPVRHVGASARTVRPGMSDAEVKKTQVEWMFTKGSEAEEEPWDVRRFTLKPGRNVRRRLSRLYGWEDIRMFVVDQGVERLFDEEGNELPLP